MSELNSYEKLLKQTNEKRRRFRVVAWLFVYATWVLLWSLIMANIGMNAPMLLFIPLTTVILVRCTWKYTSVEFEYTLVEGSLVIDKIYGKKTRKGVFEGELKSAVLIAPYTEDFLRKAEERGAWRKSIEAISSEDAEEIWFLLFESEGETRTMVFVEADDTMLRIFRHYNARATMRKL